MYRSTRTTLNGKSLNVPMQPRGRSSSRYSRFVRKAVENAPRVWQGDGFSTTTCSFLLLLFFSFLSAIFGRAKLYRWKGPRLKDSPLSRYRSPRENTPWPSFEDPACIWLALAQFLHQISVHLYIYIYIYIYIYSFFFSFLNERKGRQLLRVSRNSTRRPNRLIIVPASPNNARRFPFDRGRG